MPEIHPDIHEVVDLDRYPLHDPSHRRYKDLVAYCRDGLRRVGCTSVPDVFRPETVARSAAMVAGRAHLAHRSAAKMTAYPGTPEAGLPADHPRRARFVRGGGFICADRLDPGDGLWSFFDWPETTAFMIEAFEVSPLYRYADPLSNLAVNAMWDGDSFPWHFDTNEMTVSVMLQNAEGGGRFEYFPNIRTPSDENYGAVKRVLAGDLDGVRSLDLAPGDMQLFKGRYTLHRVTEVIGSTPRFIALPSWSSNPGQVGVVERMIDSYGRALPIHFAHRDDSPDALRH